MPPDPKRLIGLAGLLIAGTTASQTLEWLIKGDVRDGEGVPIGQARVISCHHEATYVRAAVDAETRTDDEGRFEFPAIEVTDDMAMSRFVFAHKPGFSWGARHASFRLDTTGDVPIVLLPPGTLSGRVVDGDVDPVKGAVVRPQTRSQHARGRHRLYGLAGLPFLSAVTDDKGVFTLNDMPSGATAALTVEAQGFARMTFGDLHGRRGGAVFDVPQAGIELALIPESTIAGILVREQDRTPVPGIFIFASSRETSGSGWASTGEDGRFMLKNLKAGLYQFTTRPGGRDLGGILVPPPEPVAVGESENVQDLTLQWTGGVVVTGRVLDAETKKPVRLASLYLRNEKRDGRSASGTTNSEGRFRLRVTPGEYVANVHARLQGYQPHPQVALTVAAGAQVEMVSVFLSPLSRFVVKIVDEAGKPVSGAQIMRHGDAVATCDEDGRAEMLPRERGYGSRLDYSVLSPDGSLVARFAEPGSEEKEVKVVLQRAGSVTGVVNKPDGTPLDGASVQPMLNIRTGSGGMSSHGGAAAQTDANGEYTVSGLVAGQTYGMLVSAPDMVRMTPGTRRTTWSLRVRPSKPSRSRSLLRPRK